MNALTYKEVFPLVQTNTVWLGANKNGGPSTFILRSDAAGKSGQVTAEGVRMQKFGNICWFTNLDHGQRHEPINLMTMSDNVKFSKHKEIRDIGYFKYDNFDAIEVPFTDAIPGDYDGVMGVPISFLNKYNPDQFEIVSLSRYTKTEGMSKAFVEAYYASGQTGQISVGHPDLCYFDKAGKPVVPYMRVLVRRKRV
jgi:hypothetical protein